MNRPAKGLDNSIDISMVPLPAWRARAVDFQRVELAAVRSQVRFGRHIILRPLALALIHLGNGWLYPFLAVVLLWWSPHEFGAVVLKAGVATGAAHLVYPWIKRLVARPRPFEVDPSIPPLLGTLDRYSFPSGHCMTITAVAIPLGVAHPALAMPAVLVCLAIAWARLVAAHHFPSDILAGIALGAGISLPVALNLL